MFRHIVGFEWRYQVRSPVFWVGCLIFFLLAFGATASDNVQIGSLGNVHKNAPYAIVQALALLGVFSVFITPWFPDAATHPNPESVPPA